MKVKPKAEKILCDANALVNEIELKTVKGISKRDINELEDILDRCLQNLGAF